VDTNPELYALPLAFSPGGDGPARAGGIVELTAQTGGQRGVVGDAFGFPAFAKALLELIRLRERIHNGQGEIEATNMPALRQILNGGIPAEPVVCGTAEGNVTLFFGDKLALKFFRRLETGVNPELEIGRFLTERNFAHSPALLGALECAGTGCGPVTLAVAKAFIPHAQNAWEFILDSISRYYDRVFADAAQGHAPPSAPGEGAEDVGTSLEFARHLGVRSAELHLELAAGDAGDDFSVEPMTPQYLRGLFQSMRSLAVKNLRLLRKLAKTLPPDLAPVVQRVIELEPAIVQRYRQLVEQRFMAGRIRVSGDFHLGQALWTGRDFIFLDFEGNQALPISERRIKRSPLGDVARMLRSFHHVAYAGFHQQVELGVISRENLPKFEPWVRHWNHAVSHAYMQAYCEKMRPSGILPVEENKLRVLLLAYLLNEVMDELGRELRLRSDNVRAPLQAILLLMEQSLPVRAPEPTETKTATNKTNN
ncbi:MAG: hypothetical protein ABUL66_04025, partial [Verrucomicrobiota bacterium]